MAAITDIATNAFDAYNSVSSDSSSGTTLQQFLQKFGSTKGRYIDTPDPMSTFDVKFKFFPTMTAEQEAESRKSDALSRVGSSLVNSLKSAGSNLLDNLTGGLFSSLVEGGSGSVMKQHDQFKEAGCHTFMEYLANANLLQGGEQWMNAEQAACPLELQMGFYIQSINMPNLKLGGGEKSQTMLGEFTPAGCTIDSEGSLTMDIVNTKAALHERIFYPWMRETTLHYWSYMSQPYTTANIIVDFTKHNDVKYVFTGCKPTAINLLQASQASDGSNMTRSVTFSYDYMFVTSKLDVNDSAMSKLLGTVGNLAKGAGNMLNM